MPGADLETASEARDFGEKTIALMDRDRGAAMGASARARVMSDYDWTTNLAPFEALLEDPAYAGAIAD